MNSRILMIIAFLLGGLSLELSAQDTQTLRGKVEYPDETSAVGIKVKVENTGDSTITNQAGFYEFKSLPISENLLVIVYGKGGGPESNTISLNSRRVGVLNFKIDFSSGNANEVIVDGTGGVESGSRPNVRKIKSLTTPNSEVLPPGTYMLQLEKAEQSIAAADDLSRMVMRFPGVKSWADNLADLIIRGNSPMGLMWRLEGIDIPNPNHFARKGNTGGGITMFSAQVLGNTSFQRGAMAPEYGNSFAGAFDVNFRDGNPLNHEFRARIGAIGLDFAAEGPIRKGDTVSSYLVNYRYSFLGILNAAGFNINAPFTSNNFQDLSFSINLPSKDLLSTWKVFGVGGISREFWDVDPDSIFVNGNGREERNFDTYTGVLGISYRKILPGSALFKATFAAMGNQVIDRDEQIDITGLPMNFNPSTLNTLNREVVENEVYSTGRYSTHLYYKKYFGSGQYKTTFQAGLQASHITFDFIHDDIIPFGDSLTTLVQGQGSSQLIQPYVQVVKPFYKNKGGRPFQTWKLVGGVHSMVLTLNGKVTVDPRIAATYNYSRTGSFALSYGIHSRIVPLGSYFTKDEGEFVNRDLDMIRSHHLIGSFKQITNLGVLLVEGYYQYLFNVPVSVESSAYWLLNDRDGYATEALQSTGTGLNAGVDVSLMRPLFDGVFWTITGSVYRSTATTSDGITRPSSFIGPEEYGFYTANTIGGEFPLNKRRTVFMQLGANLIVGTGTRFIAADEDASLRAGQLVLDPSGIYSQRTGNYHRLDTRVAVRFGSWLISIDLQNATNNEEEIRGNWMRFGAVGLRPQTGFTPLFSIRTDF